MAVITGMVLRDGIGEAVLDGIGAGAVMASLAAWRRWPSPGRRYFAKRSA